MNSDIAAAMCINGLTTEAELIALHRFAKLAPAKGFVVELGCFNGRSTAVLCSAAGSDRVVAVDNFKMAHHGDNNPKITAGNLALLGYTPWLIRQETYESVDEITHVAMLFIDSRHSPEELQLEMQEWQPKLLPGAVVALHDYGRPAYKGFTEAIDSIFVPPAWYKLGLTESLIGFSK